MKKFLLVTILSCNICFANDEFNNLKQEQLLQEQLFLELTAKNTRPEDCEDEPVVSPQPRGKNNQVKAEEEGTGGYCKPH